MSIQLSDLESSGSSPQMKKNRICSESSTSNELSDFENSVCSYYSSSKLKRRKVCDESTKSMHLFDSENSIGSSPQSKKRRIYRTDKTLPKNIKIDEDDHIVLYRDLIIDGKYKVLGTLGQGAFGRVVKVQNLHTNKTMALKTTKNVEAYRKAAKHEIKVLERIAKEDLQDTSLCIKMLDSFDFHGHICIVFEALGSSLHQHLAKNHYLPFPLDQVRHIGHQLCQSVNFLHRNNMIHTDLKPDNVLFVDPKNVGTDVRLIDFGSVVLNQQLRKTNISTRFYRAPEVVLELGWTDSSDVWSIGCILFELYIGEMLFVIPDNRQHHLAVMEKILGEFPQTMTCENKNNYFVESKVNFDWSNVIEDMKNYYKPLNEYMLSQCKDDIELFDLIRKMLIYEPSKRIKLDVALEHSFFAKLTKS